MTDTILQFDDIETIVWDLDGTLLDSFGIQVDIMATVLPRHGYRTPTPDEVSHNFHGRLIDDLGTLSGETDPDTLQALVDDFMATDNEYMKDVNHHLFVDAVVLAKHAHKAGIRQILVTNRHHRVESDSLGPRNMIKNSALRDYIDTVICGNEVKLRKPYPEVLGSIRHQINPERMLVIGDQFVDAQLAHNIGARGILINRYADPIPHLDRLTEDCRLDTTIVNSLSSIRLSSVANALSPV